MKEKLSRYFNRGSNFIVLVGEIVNYQIIPGTRKGKFDFKATLKIRTRAVKNTDVYVNVVGKNYIADDMNLTCHTGNVVLTECEFRNKRLANGALVPYLLCMRVTCLRRHDVESKLVNPNFDKSILKMLDDLDPIKYTGFIDNTIFKQEEGHEDE